MIDAQAETLIERPVTAVWGFVAIQFFENYPRWSPEVELLERLTAGPVALGSAMRQVRTDRGRRTDTAFEVVRFEPPRRLEFREFRGRYRIGYHLSAVDPDPGRTRLRFAIEVKRPGLLLRPLEPLLRSAITEGAAGVVESIRALVEAGTP